MHTPRRTYNFSGMTVLIADSNRFIRQIVGKICRGFGFAQVHETADGMDALRITKEHRIDIIILDWPMEPLDGFELTRMLRSAVDSPNPFIPILLLTGHVDRRRVMAARDLGVTEILAKPVSANTLLHRLVHICEKPRPFVRCPGYFGPERRRRQVPLLFADRRGHIPAGPPPPAETDGWGMSQDEIDALLG